MTFDVATRLAAGRPAVANTQAYVDACRAVGYQNADLTAHGAQADEWYATEDGMDLTTLDADCATLRAAAGAAEDALRIERTAMAALASAWNGESGSAADDFLQRHCAGGAAVVDAVRAAAEACTALRDRLWALIDGKVGAATAIDDRRSAQRAAWLTAARTVTTGAGDRADSIQIVTREILPYVDGDIRTEWVGAMRSATVSVDTAYDAAVQVLGANGATDFAVPPPLGPPVPPTPIRPTPVVPPAAGGHTAPPAITTPAAAAPPVTAPAAPAPGVPAAPPTPEMPAAQPIPAPTPTTPPGADLASPSGAAPETGLPPNGMGSGSGGGLSALVSEIIDALGGLFDEPADDAVDELPDDKVDDPGPVDPPDGEDHPADGPKEVLSDDAPATATEPSAPQSNPSGPDAAEPPVDGAPAQPAEPEPPPTAPPPTPTEPDPATPCDIAADELPQVGQ